MVPTLVCRMGKMCGSLHMLTQGPPRIQTKTTELAIQKPTEGCPIRRQVLTETFPTDLPGTPSA